MGRMQLGAVFREPTTHTPPERPRIRHATSNQSLSLPIDNGGITRAVRQLAKLKRGHLASPVSTGADTAPIRVSQKTLRVT